jgi:hypothetical protein
MGQKLSWRPPKRHFPVYPYERNRQTGQAGPFRADIVAKVENRTTLKISRKLILDFSAASLFNATMEVRDQFWMKRYVPHVAARKTHQRL